MASMGVSTGIEAYCLLILCLLIAYVIIAHWPQKRPGQYRQVPRLKGYPLLGNMHQLSCQPQRELKQWARQYGELFEIQLGWENWILVNSAEAIKEIFDNQASKTSSRVPMPVACDMISGGIRIVLMPYSTKWKKLRGIVHRLLTPTMSNAFRPTQEFEAKQLVYDIMTDNSDQHKFYMHARRYTASVMMTSTYGRRIPSPDSDEIREIYDILKEFSINTSSGTFVADLIPSLARLPLCLQWWRKSALAYQRHQSEFWMRYWTDLKKLMEKGEAPDCFATQWMTASQESQGMDDIEGAFIAGTAMIEAGSESTSATLISCLKYLGANPRAQLCAHEELSRITGNVRSPTYSDKSSCHYVRSCVKEILRLRPSTNNGSPHYTTADVIYKDYLIPKGTVVSINQYALYSDPSRYLDPEEFKPERFLDDGDNDRKKDKYADPYGPDRYVWGGGKRICPGVYLAENSLFITVAKILWAFQILPPVDEHGQEIALDVSDNAYENGRVTIPKPFQLRFIPRSSAIEHVVRSEWREANEDGLG